MLSFAFVLFAASAARAALTNSNLETYADSLALDFTFDPIKASYWTGYPHHRRTPFSVSPDGTTAYIAYLDSSETDVHVQQVDPSTFAAVGTAVTVTGGKEAGGLVAQNDGFALLTNEALPSGTADAPADSTPVPVIYRYTDGTQTWKTFVGGPGVHTSDGLSASPDMNGDLAYSSTAGLYGAYFVVTDYSGDASGHYGDSIEYVNEAGELQTLADASMSWGCSHNTGIAFEAADAAPFASICAEDQGAIWLNTGITGMSNTGVKISNENTTNGGGGESLGGMSGSYSGLARFQDADSYVFTWVSRGAIDLTENTWMGTGYTNAQNRTNPRNVAIALFSDKSTMTTAQASSEVGATDGDSQVNWITSGANDCSNAHTATFDNSNAIVTWEEISDPICDYIAMGCRGTFAGTKFQQVNAAGEKVGASFSRDDVYVSGDMVTMSDGRVCWPYVSGTWDLSQAVGYSGSGVTTQKMSFACMSLDGTSNATTTAASSAAASSTVASSVAAAAVSSTPVASSSVLASSDEVAAVATSSVAASSASSAAAEATSAPSSTPAQTTLATSFLPSGYSGRPFGTGRPHGTGFAGFPSGYPRPSGGFPWPSNSSAPANATAAGADDDDCDDGDAITTAVPTLVTSTITSDSLTTTTVYSTTTIITTVTPSASAAAADASSSEECASPLTNTVTETQQVTVTVSPGASASAADASSGDDDCDE